MVAGFTASSEIMKAATAFVLALLCPYGIAFVQLSSVGNTGRYHRKLDERHHHRSPIASKQHASSAEAARDLDLMPDSQTLSEVSLKRVLYNTNASLFFDPHMRM